MTSPSNPFGANSDENLRDARLLQALQHMPDAHMQPSAHTRQAVLQEALRAAAPQPTAVSRWWHAWFGRSDQRMPWSAALASLAIASFVTVLWYGQEVPEANSERSPVVQREEASRDTSKDASKGTAEMASGPRASMAADRAVARSDALGNERMKDHDAPAAAPVTAVVEAELRAQAPPAAAPSAAPPEREVAQEAARAASPSSPAAAPSFAVGGLAKAQAYSSPSQRNLSNTPALADAEAGASAESKVNSPLTIFVGGVKRSLRPEQAQNLLNLLRGLSYGPAVTPPQREDSDADLIVEIAGQERWTIAPGRVVQQQAGATRVQSDITPAQYATLRRLANLAMEPKVQP